MSVDFEKVWQIIRNFFIPKLNKWFFIRLGVTVILAVVVFKFLLVPCVISGASMEPTVHSSGFTFCCRARMPTIPPADCCILSA